MPMSNKSLKKKIKRLQTSAIKKGLPIELILRYRNILDLNVKEVTEKRYIKKLLAIVLIIILLIVISIYLWSSFLSIRCLIPSNYLIWELARPIADCNYCTNVSNPIILWNITHNEFLPYAYSSKPIIVKNAINHWKARKVFNFKMFKKLYQETVGSYDSIDEGCQFLNFKTDLFTLKEVFEMSEERARNKPGQKPWYVGWGNCHLDILSTVRKYYDIPYFLPEDAEFPATENIFFGYEIGAVMHLDYIPRLMWQGQVRGNKYWTIAPVPECEHLCQPTNFYVEAGDILLLDTRVWYHSTRIPKRQLSITVQSEYG